VVEVTQHNTTQHNTMTSLPSAKRTKLQYECPTRALVSVSGKGNYRRAIKAREEWLIHNGWSSVTTGASATKLPDNIKYVVYYSKPDRASRAELEWTRKRKHYGTNTIGGLRTRHKSKV